METTHYTGYVVSKDGVCGNCVSGLMVDCTIDYGVVCRIDSKDHSRWDTCTKFKEEK